MKNKWLLLALWAFGLAYAGAYHWCYWSYLYPVWEYLGFAYVNPPLSMVLTSYGFAAAGASFLPERLERPSHFVLWVIYLVIYVPSVFVPVFLHLSSDTDVLRLMGALLLGFFLISACSGFRLVRLPFPTIPINSFIIPLAFVVLGLFVWVSTIYYGQFSLVAFDKVYDDVRANSSLVEMSSGVNYGICWLSYFLLPLIMTIALSRRNWALFALGSAGILLMYSTSGLRSIAVSIVTLPACYFYFHTNRKPRGFDIGFGLAALMVGLVGLFLIVDVEDIPGFHTVLSMVIMRTAGTTGYLTGLYYDFFQANPLTYFTHLRIFSLAGLGAYSEQLGVLIGRTYTTSSEICMNANFWATDGIAALGLIGIPFISIFVGILLYLIDVVSQRHRLEVVVTSLLPIILLMCNISIFTTLLTGGLFFWLVAMAFMPPEIARNSKSKPRQNPIAASRAPVGGRRG